MRLLQLVLPWCWLLQAIVLANVYRTAFIKQTDFNGQSVELYAPFSLCGTLDKLSLVDNAHTNAYLLKQRCIIGCVNKTSHAFRVGVYVCDGSLTDFTLPVSFTDMNFMVECSDAKFIAQGRTLHNRLDLQLVPNLSCLQNGPNVSCIRVTKYEKIFEPSLGALQEQQEFGTVDLGINKTIWKQASMNSDANIRSVSLQSTISVMRSQFVFIIVTVILVLPLLCTQAKWTRNRCSLREFLGGWYIAQFEPFVVCGKVNNFISSGNILFASYFPPERLGCTVGCINRTTSSVVIEIYSCNSEDEMMRYQISLNEMKFFTCYTDERITLRADNMARLIEFTLEPD
uniref:Uncharacterized protein n=1 Tax=Anopheles maculatus TaxID=74869 RepID=A0A182SIR3_9DIPT